MTPFRDDYDDENEELVVSRVNIVTSRLNDDGSYTYGYEAADGTFKLETRFADGSVQGKYGYIDVNGEVKIIEYYIF